ncbi:MAG: O-antigen ligase family protein [Muribaculaceae bacterium]|nr:O-antigen ligase family protein [Muribaculaceae bacterium]
MNNNDTVIRIVKTYIWIIFLIPTFWGFTPGSNTLGQLFVSFFLFLFVIFSTLYVRKKIKFIKSYFLLFFLQITSYSITLGIRQTDLFSGISLSDYTDISRPVLYLFAISFPFSLDLKQEDVLKITRTIVKVSLLVALFDIIKLFPQGETIMKLYTPLKPSSFNYQRLSGTFAYCYNYGFILILDLLLILYYSNHKLIYSLFTIILIFLTGSRSVLIATIMALFLYFVISPRSILSKISIIAVASVSIIVLYGLISSLEIPIIQDITTNIDKLLSIADNGISADGSAATRGRQIEVVFKNFHTSPICGSGPLKESAAPIEIQFGYYLSAWGILGLCIILSLLFMTIYYSYKTIKISSDDSVSFSKANLIWIISGVFVGMSTPITDQIRVFQLYYLVQGIQFCIYYQNKKSYSMVQKDLVLT